MFGLSAFILRRWSETRLAQRAGWLSVLVAVVLALWLPTTLRVLSNPLSLQDDARMYVFWTQQYADPELFRGDLIADYLRSVSPVGYRTLYRSAVALGFSPFDFAKVLGIGIALAAALLAFLVTLEICGLPFAAFLASLLVSQSLCMSDSVPSGTPRAFAVLMLLAFLYAYLRRSLFGSVTAIVLQGCFYPHTVLISLGTSAFGLIHRSGAWFAVTRDHAAWLLIAAIWITGVMALWPYATGTSEYGPTVTRTQAEAMIEFGKDGRSRFFDPDTRRFWINGERSGLLGPIKGNGPVMLLGLLLPLLFRARSVRAVAVEAAPAKAAVLWHMGLASFALFALAHVLLFRLYNPNRYTQFSWYLVLDLAAGITVTLLLAGLLSRSNGAVVKHLAKGTLAMMIGAVLILSWLSQLDEKMFPKFNLRTGRDAALYAFLATTPKGSLVASLSSEANFIPSLAARPVLVGREYAIPYQLGYYQRFRQRARDLIGAQYSAEPARVLDFIRLYHIRFWVLDKDAFKLVYLPASWARQYPPEVTQAAAFLSRGGHPLLQQLSTDCTVLETQLSITLDANCLSLRLEQLDGARDRNTDLPLGVGPR